MASITIRNLDDDLKRRLRERADSHNRSIEEEAGDILRVALAREPQQESLFDVMRRRVAPLGGFELPMPSRKGRRSRRRIPLFR